jgi:nicotinamidase/pyrazinamidase
MLRERRNIPGSDANSGVRANLAFRQAIAAVGRPRRRRADIVSRRAAGGSDMIDYEARTALLVVDVQNDFADPAGSLYVAGGEAVVPIVNGEISRALSAGATVLYTQDWHPESTPHFQKDGGIWPVHCVRDTWGAAFRPDLAVRGSVLRKGTGGEDGYSAFSVRDPRSGAESDTVLERTLRDRRIESVVVAGLATDYCVKETVLDAAERGFTPFVILDAVRAVDLQVGDGTHAIEAMREAGAQLK